MEKIKVNKITPQTVECFDPNNNSLGFLNEYEFHDLRVQIKREKVKGYYCIFDNRELFIDINGRIAFWPEGFFDVIENYMIELL